MFYSDRLSPELSEYVHTVAERNLKQATVVPKGDMSFRPRSVEGFKSHRFRPCENQVALKPVGSTVPKHVSDVHNAVDSVEDVTTHHAEKFVLQNDRQNHVVIVGCESNQNQLDAAGIILMDGTF